MLQGVLDGPNYTDDDMGMVLPDGSCLGHYVAIVGYGELLGQLYWFIKNSYSKYFGLGGFMMLARETGKPGGAFGITRSVSYPLKTSPNRYCRVLSERDMGL
jgi:hypothetical protein